MPRRSPSGHVPQWSELYESAGAQAGYFSLRQAHAAGYSSQLLQHYLRTGEIERSLRGVFRLVHFPASDREDLVPVWLWSKSECVFGLETALSLYDLSDVLPAHFDAFVPRTWKARRIKPPPNVRLHIDDVPPADRQWIGPVPVTTVARTLRDCITHHVSPDIVEQAMTEAVQRKLLSLGEAQAIQREAA